MKKQIQSRYFSWMVMLSVAMTVAGTLLLSNLATKIFTSNQVSFFWNTLLVNITFMGDACFAFGVVLFLLFFLRKRILSSRLLIAIFICLLITQALKNIFSGLPIQLFFESSNKDYSNSFQLHENLLSSHVAIAFTLAGFFSLYIKRKRYKIVLLLLALSVLFSRMALMGESLLTVVLGLVPAIGAMLFLYKFVHKKTRRTSYFYQIAKQRKLGEQHIAHG